MFLEYGKTVFQTTPYVLTRAKQFFFHILEIYGLHLDLGHSYAMRSTQKINFLII